MGYIKENVEAMLKQHKHNEAKLTEIELKLEEYKARLNYAGLVYEDTEKEVIEGMQLSGQVISDMPKSKTNKVSDITYNTVIDYRREKRHINKEDRNFIERKIEKLEEEKDILNKAIVRIKNIMTPLSQEERFVIEAYYMDKAKWNYVSQQYSIEYQKSISINQLLNIRDSAIESMLEILNAGD